MKKQLQIAILGAGNRAGKYLGCLPADAAVAAIVEPDTLRRQRLLALCPGASGFADMAGLLKASPALDAVIIAAPDRSHVPLALACAAKGWNILMEKPVAQNLEDYLRLMEACRGITVGVCLEMRLHPYYRRVKELIPQLGKVLRVQHSERIGADRMGHTFVRGLWSSCSQAGPIFLSKCSHDTDFLLWALGGTPVSVHSEGRLERFRPGSAPAGSTARCLDCPLSRCPYNAVNLYRVRGEWTGGFVPRPGETLSEEVERELSEGRYGRCVYHCQNDVNDYQEVKVLLDNGIQLDICLDGLSVKEGRSTLIEGRDAFLEARDWKIYWNGALLEDYSHLASAPLHAGADRALVEDFLEAIRTGRRPAAPLEDALAAHRVCFLAG